MRWATIMVLVLAACGGSAPQVTNTGERPVRFRVLSQGQNAAYCVAGPEFAVAGDEAAWRGALERSRACQPGADAQAPRVDLDEEFGIAAWWGVKSCLGHRIETVSVTRTRSDALVVSASSHAPEGACAQALGGLESFLAVDRADAEGTTVARFVLDVAFAGSAPMPS